MVQKNVELFLKNGVYCVQGAEGADMLEFKLTQLDGNGEAGADSIRYLYNTITFISAHWSKAPETDGYNIRYVSEVIRWVRLWTFSFYP